MTRKSVFHSPNCKKKFREVKRSLPAHISLRTLRGLSVQPASCHVISIIGLGSCSKHVRVRESVALPISFRQGTFPCTCLLAGKLWLASIQGKSFVFFTCVCWQLPVTHSPSEAATYQHIHGITHQPHHLPP